MVLSSLKRGEGDEPWYRLFTGVATQIGQGCEWRVSRPALSHAVESLYRQGLSSQISGVRNPHAGEPTKQMAWCDEESSAFGMSLHAVCLIVESLSWTGI